MKAQGHITAFYTQPWPPPHFHYIGSEMFMPSLPKSTPLQRLSRKQHSHNQRKDLQWHVRALSLQA